MYDKRFGEEEEDDDGGFDLFENVPVQSSTEKSIKKQEEDSLEHEMIDDQDNNENNFMKIPEILDETFKDGNDHAVLVNLSKIWEKRTTEFFIEDEVSEKSLLECDQEDERNSCFDLLDALTKSGTISISDATLQILIINNHAFDKNLIKTVIEDNLNPIESIKKSLFTLAKVLHNVSSDDELKR